MRRELDRFLIAAPAKFAAVGQAIVDVRRAWWEYISLMGLSADEAGGEEPAFIQPEDERSTNVAVMRRPPRERAGVASIRLEPGSDGAPAILTALAFRPEEANETTETLILRVALLHARFAGVSHVRADVPILRREIYEALGFAVD